MCKPTTMKIPIIIFFIFWIGDSIADDTMPAELGSAHDNGMSTVTPNTEKSLPTSSGQTWQGQREQSSKIRIVRPPYEEESEVCTTPECVRTASEILQNMDFNVQPCDNFYNFVCGGFLNSIIIPEDRTVVNTFTIVEDELNQQLRADIEEEINENESRPFRIAKILYKSCMNTTLIEKQGLEPLRKILRELGGWPILEADQWAENDFNWINSTYKFEKLGYSADFFMSFGVISDPKNSTRRIMDLGEPWPGLPREYLLEGFNNSLVQAVYNYMLDIALMLGANETRAKEELKKVFKFQMELASITRPREESRNITLLFNPMTINELNDKYKFVSWKDYFNNQLPKNLQVEEDETINVSVPSFFHDLERLLRVTPKRTQANYIMLRVPSFSSSYLDEEIRDKTLAFLKVATGITKRQPRWEECVGVVSKYMGKTVGAMYVRKHFKEDAKKHALEIVTDIREQFRKILEQVEWMDEKTKKNALEKAASMFAHVAYPDELLDDRKLGEFYAKLDLSEGNYLESILNLERFHREYSLSLLRKPVNKSDWISHGNAAVINAEYRPLENSIAFSAGILQGAFFNNERPRYINYGAIGSIIGHEITHGFDDQGSEFDKNGLLVNWWAPETKEKYLEKAKCIIEQYGNYTVEGVGSKLNGKNTLGENIADNGGVKAAYLAYKEWVRRNGHSEPLLPNLNYTGQQMFWISAAHTWCATYRPESLKLNIITDVHSPEEFRVVGPFSNMEEFAQDFDCPLDSKMNPRKKCSVW